MYAVKDEYVAVDGSVYGAHGVHNAADSDNGWAVHDVYSV